MIGLLTRSARDAATVYAQLTDGADSNLHRWTGRGPVLLLVPGWNEDHRAR